jgi:hypothetical protein
MKRFEWSAVVGLGVAGLLIAAPPARATDDTSKSSSSSASGGLSGHDTASGGHDTAATSEKSGDASDRTATGTGSGSSSEARGSGQGGVSTGARPGEVTGSQGTAGGTSEREAAKAAEGTHQLWGKVEKFDREKRTLSLEDSDKKLKVTDDTQIMKDGNRVSPGQIMEGDEVRASYAGTGDAEVVEVTIIEVVPALPDAGTGSSRGSSSMPPPATGGSDKASGSSSDVGSGSTGTKSPSK